MGKGNIGHLETPTLYLRTGHEHDFAAEIELHGWLGISKQAQRSCVWYCKL